MLRLAARSPAARTLMARRIAIWAEGPLARRPVRVIATTAYRLWAARANLDIPFAADIGPGLKILHTAGGVVVSARAKIGPGCTIVNGVTVGAVRDGARPGAPTVGARSYLSAGAVVIGALELGDDVVVAANAVVTNDAPAHSVLAGIPAVATPIERSAVASNVDMVGALGPEPT